MTVDPLATLSDHLAAWTAAGWSQASFARDVLGRDPETLRGWLRGRTIPATVADWLSRLHTVRMRRDGRVETVITPKPAETPGRKARP